MTKMNLVTAFAPEMGIAPKGACAVIDNILNTMTETRQITIKMTND